MAIIDDPDFLTDPAKQLRAVHELANLRVRMVDLETELLARRHERRTLIERLAEQNLAEQRQEGRQSRTAAQQSARASQDVRNFDTNVRSLREKIRRLEIEAERFRLSIEVAIAAAGNHEGLAAASAATSGGQQGTLKLR
ncbi:MAG TPA: hypothetical protein VFJ96_02195 [Gemmatimonadaceae bacterium]|jgi:hypothetical protein|nr:hypothetical protein [Gemmatimonadaceae bacterium]